MGEDLTVDYCLYIMLLLLLLLLLQLVVAVVLLQMRDYDTVFFADHVFTVFVFFSQPI